MTSNMQAGVKKLAKKKTRELSRTWSRSRRHHLGRYGFQQYLAAVYACYDELRATKGLASKVRDYLRRRNSLSSRLNGIGVLIATSSGENGKTRGRWTQALRYAWKWRDRWQSISLEELFALNGGVAGCAANYTSGIKPRVR
jgi:hypothetical protein